MYGGLNFAAIGLHWRLAESESKASTQEGTRFAHFLLGWFRGCRPRNPRRTAPASDTWENEKTMPKSEKKKRTKEIKLRLTEEEHLRLSALAGDSPLAEWIREFSLRAAQSDIFAHLEQQYLRQAAKRAKRREALSVSPELLRALSGIGNNINQIARHCNSAARSGQALNMAAVALELNAIGQTLKAIRADHRQEELL